MRDDQLPPSPDGEEPEEHLSPGHLGPIGAGTLVAWALAGFAVGWSWHWVADRTGEAVPVGWLQGLALWFMAAVLAGVAYVTRRAVRSREATIDPTRMVNRLVLARACTVVGALVAGGYLGYGLTWLGSHPDLVVGRVGRALLATLGGLLVLVCGKLLERACRVPPGPPQP